MTLEEQWRELRESLGLEAGDFEPETTISMPYGDAPVVTERSSRALLTGLLVAPGMAEIRFDHAPVERVDIEHDNYIDASAFGETNKRYLAGRHRRITITVLA